MDQRLYGFNRDLNALQRLGSTDIIQASPADVKSFVSWLKDVMENPEIAYPRARRSGSTPKEPFQGDTEGSYNYDRKSNWRKAPDGVTRELPKVPKWKRTEELRKKGLTDDSPTPAEPSPEEVKKPTAEDETLKKSELATPDKAGPPARPWDYPAPTLPTPPVPEVGPSSP